MAEPAEPEGQRPGTFPTMDAAATRPQLSMMSAASKTVGSAALASELPQPDSVNTDSVTILTARQFLRVLKENLLIIVLVITHSFGVKMGKPQIEDSRTVSAKT